MHEGANGRSIDDTFIFDENVITDLHRKERDTLGELLERWPNDASLSDDTVLADLDRCQVTANDAVGHDDRLPLQNDIL